MNVYERTIAERLQAEAARIPLPPRERWLPRERSSPRLMPMLATLAVLAVAVLVAAPLLGRLNSRVQVTSSPPPQAVAVAPTGNLAPARYEASVLLSDARDVTALAISDRLLVLARNVTGARPSDTRSSVAVMPLSGGSPTTLTGTEAVGVFVGGVTVFQGGIYFSRGFGASPGDSGIFRPAATPPNSPAQPVVAGPGSPATLSPNGDGGPASAASLDRPAGIAFNTAGDLFIAESGAGRVRRVSGDGVISTYAGRGPCGDALGPSSGPATQVPICGPELLAVNAAGDLFVTRRGGGWIVKMDHAGTLSVFNNDFQASGLAIDTNDALLATDGRAGRVVRFDATGHPTTIADGLGLVLALAVGPDGSIYVLNSTAPSGTLLPKITKLRPVSTAVPSLAPTVKGPPAPIPPSANASAAAWAVACGTISDYQGNTSSTNGSMVLNSPGRSPLKITLTSAHSTPGGGIGGYVCAGLVAGVPSPIFDGLFPPNTAGFINQGALPATAAQPAPTGFVLPQACAFVATPVVGTDDTRWAVDCGAQANHDARGTLGPALTQQGWTGCAIGLGTMQVKKNGVMLSVRESTLAPGEYPGLTQFARLISPCT